jgi:hypothetical protein
MKTTTTLRVSGNTYKQEIYIEVITKVRYCYDAKHLNNEHTVIKDEEQESALYNYDRILDSEKTGQCIQNFEDQYKLKKDNKHKKVG